MSSIPLIDPTGPLGLRAKYQNALEKGKILAIRIEFTPKGVVAMGLKKGGDAAVAADWLPIAEAMTKAAEAVEERPFEDEKAHFVSKYEVRLDEEAPQGLRDAATAADLKAAIAALEFRKRRALQMSNREFELAFLRWENGGPIVRPAEEAEKLRQEQVTARGGGARGRGRGGRGRGAFRGAEEAPGGSS